MRNNDNIAVDVIDRFQRSYPVDVHAIAEALNLKVQVRSLSDQISGKIEKDWPSDDYVITVNSLHGRNRQRFTIAHEIAHYVLHRDLIGDGIIDDGLYRDNRIGDRLERQANRYAASILMPRNLVERAYSEGVDNYRKLAKAFEVSQAVAEIRWQELGCDLWHLA